MKDLLTTLVILVTFYCYANAQRYSTEFGKVGKDEIDLKVYDKDETAQAVVLFDIGESSFTRESEGFDILFERQKRIKILSESGIEFAEVEIPFYREGNIYERIFDLEAITYNFENGALTRTILPQESWHDEKVNDYWMVRKFAFPNVKQGSIIEFRYKLSSQYLFNLRDWEFQSKIPTVFSKYIVKMIPFYEYSYILQGGTKLDSQESYIDRGLSRQFGPVNFQDYVHIYTMKDIPAFDSEKFITSINDYIIKIDFQLAKINYLNGGSKEIMTTWPKLIDELNKHIDFGKFIKKSEKTAPKLLDSKSLAGKPDNEKFEYILNYVKENYKWNGYNGKYSTKSTGDLIKDKFGSSADLNLLTVGLLNAIGIEAYPLLVSTRQNGKIKVDYPYSHFFNYVLIFAKVGDKNVLTDATEIFTSNYRIPERCINDKGLLITENEEVKWIGLQSRIPSILSYDFKIDFNNNKSNVSVETYASEYEAYDLKKKIDSNEKLIDFLKESDYDVDEESINLKTDNLKDQNFRCSFVLSVDPENINEKLYVSPFLNETLNDNPLNQKSRSYPIDMIYPTKNLLTSSIAIPDGYEIDYIPDDSRINNDLFELQYSVNQKDNFIKIIFLSYFKKAVYSADEYSKIKFYFNEIVKRSNEKVVFKKI